MQIFKIFLFQLIILLSSSLTSNAFEIIPVTDSINAINLRAGVDVREGKDGRIQLITAAGEDGIVRNIEVLAFDENTNPNWALFALKNETDISIDRLLVAPFFRQAGSGVFSPDLGANRIGFLTVSQGLRPKRVPDAEADVFLVTIDPGASVTYIAELSDEALPELYLWEPDAYKDYINSFTLFRGTVLGIAGLAAVFLSIMFVVKGRGVFPATAAFAWAVLIYLLIDFGVMGRLLGVGNGSIEVFRAGAEAGLAITLFGFLFIYLNLHRWHIRFIHIALALLVVFIALFVTAFFEPEIAATISRLALAILGLVGLALIIILGIRGYDRAVLLLPTWIIYLAWLVYAWLVISGQVSNDIAQPAIAGGLVLIVMLIGFTAVQHAFSDGQISIGSVSEIERRALAITGSGDFVFDWNIDRDRVFVSKELLTRLGAKKGELQGAIKRWLDRVHIEDKERFRSALDTLIELKRGKIKNNIRLVHSDNSYRTFLFKVKPVVGSDGQVTRIVGTLQDISHESAARERLLHDSVNDSLTGIPNKELFLDRLERALLRSREGGSVKPAVFFIDIDDFDKLDEKIGLSASDSVLLATSRRIARQLHPLDSVARLSGDQFAVLLANENNASNIAKVAEQIQKAMRVPFNFGANDISLTVSIGITIYDNSEVSAKKILHDSELAMVYAKRNGGDRIEAYRVSTKSIAAFSSTNESDIIQGLLKNEFYMLFQPIININDNRVVGAEALMRWGHPTKGFVKPEEFIALAERTGQIEGLGKLAFEQAAKVVQQFSDGLPLEEDFFVSVNLSVKQLANENMLSNMKHMIALHANNIKHLKLEVTETQIMGNAEHSAYVLNTLKSMGLSLVLDDFGTGYSSLSYLHRFPFDSIKIPSQFVQIRDDAALAHTQVPIIRSIISLAKELNMSVIAEGVETKQELERLRQLECDYVQGFFFGAAMSDSKLFKLLEKQYGTKNKTQNQN